MANKIWAECKSDIDKSPEQGKPHEVPQETEEHQLIGEKLLSKSKIALFLNTQLSLKSFQLPISQYQAKMFFIYLLR